VTQSESPRSLIAWTIGLLALTVILAWALYQIRGTLLLIYVSALFAIGFSPVVRFIERQRVLPIGTRRLPRGLAILVLYLAIIGAAVFVGWLVFPPLIQQARELWAALPTMFDRTQTYLIERGVLDHRITWTEAMKQAPGSGADAVGTVIAAILSVGGGVFGFFSILILTFYLLVESQNLLGAFLQLFPRGNRARVAGICREITVKVSAWLTGQLVLGGVIGCSAALGLWLLGIPYFYVLALIAGIGEMIPVVGPLLAAIPAIAVAFTVSPMAAVYVAIFFILQQQFENHVLVPKIMEAQVGVSAVTVIIALMIGGSLLGIMGAILAVPTAAILQVIIQELLSSGEALDSLPD